MNPTKPTFRALLRAIFFPRADFDVCFANERRDSTDVVGVPCFANEYSDERGWIQLSPFGTFPNAQGKQVFNAADATNIVNEWRGLANTGLRLLGLPMYEGHPDHPAFESKYPNKGAVGRFKELEARHDPKCRNCAAFMANEEQAEPCREHGLFGKCKFNAAGKALVANETYHGHSVNWAMHREADGWHPHFLKSVGFTNEPGIPVPAITAANEKQNMNTFFERISKLLGKTVANEDEAYGALETMANEMGTLRSKCDGYATKYGANEKLEPALAAATAAGIVVPATDAAVFMANELVTRTAASKAKDAELATATTTVSTLTTERDGLKTGKQAVETNFANERRSTATRMLDFAVTTGCLTKADRDALAKDKDFANEAQYAGLVEASKAWKPKINVVSQVGQLGGVSAEIQSQHSRQLEVETFVNEDMARDKEAGTRPDYNRSFAKCKREKPELFTAMKKPEVSVEGAGAA